MPGISNSASKQLRRAGWSKGIVTVAASMLPAARSRVNRRLLRRSQSLGRRSGPGKFRSIFLSAASAGMAAVIACAGFMSRPTRSCARRACGSPLVGAIISPILLVMDLGRPHLFLNMLRVFNTARPCRWAPGFLALFGAFAVPAWLVLELTPMTLSPLRSPRSCSSSRALLTVRRAFRDSAWRLTPACFSARLRSQPGFCTAFFLPIHFGTAGLGSAAAILELARLSNAAAQRDRNCCRDCRNAALDLARDRQARRGRSCAASKVAPAGSFAAEQFSAARFRSFSA